MRHSSVNNIINRDGGNANSIKMIIATKTSKRCCYSGKIISKAHKYSKHIFYFKYFHKIVQ